MTTISEVVELRQIGDAGSKIIQRQQTGDEADTHPALPPRQSQAPDSSSILRIVTITAQLAAINFFASFNQGVVVIGLPRIAADINLPSQLYLWPTSVYGLTSGSTLLIAGSIADVVGSRSVDLVGCLLIGIFALAGGLSKTGIQLVIFRALYGIAISMHLPSSVSLVTRSVPSGKPRNIAFSCLGLSQPLGFSFGLVIGGVLVDTVGWRVGFYIPAAVTLALTIAGLWTLPRDPAVEGGALSKLWTEIDWIGAIIAGAGLAILSYVLAVLSADSSNIRSPSTIALLTISVLLMPCFPIWIRHQEKHSRPALIPNSIWKNRVFTSICIMVLFSWAVTNSMELFCSLFFQQVQILSPLQSSLRLLPSLVVGTALNLTTGLFIDKAPAAYLILFTSVLTAVSSLLMALINPAWSYWHSAFFAQILEPMSGDVLFTIGIIIVSDVFPERTQALAGAVFSTVSQFGISLGLSTMQVVSNLVTEGTRYKDKASPQALWSGYRASFWAMFAAMIVCCGVAGFGLRKVGKVGLKRD